MLKRGLHHIEGLDIALFSCELVAAGWEVFQLPPGIRDKVGLFCGVISVLPLDPPVGRDDDWNALSDSLWEGLYQLSAKRIAILWPESAKMLEAAPKEAQFARDIFSYLTESLADPKPTVGKVKEVAVVLA